MLSTESLINYYSLLASPFPEAIQGMQGMCAFIRIYPDDPALVKLPSYQ